MSGCGIEETRSAARRWKVEGHENHKHEKRREQEGRRKKTNAMKRVSIKGPASYHMNIKVLTSTTAAWKRGPGDSVRRVLPPLLVTWAPCPPIAAAGVAFVCDPGADVDDDDDDDEGG